MGRAANRNQFVTEVFRLRSIDAASALEILDAHSLETVASVHIPHLIPPGFHGNWIAAN